MPDSAERVGPICNISRGGLMFQYLADEGVTPIESLGQPFDPAVHEAVAVEPAAEAEVEENTVTAEFQKGYLYEGELLRPARVRVSKAAG